MSTFLYTLGRWSFRHPWRVLVGWLLILGIAGGGVALLAKGTDNTFAIPGTESQAGLEMLERTFPQVSGASAEIIVVSADGSTINDRAYRDAIGTATADIGDLDFVAAVTDPYDGMISAASPTMTAPRSSACSSTVNPPRCPPTPSPGSSRRATPWHPPFPRGPRRSWAGSCSRPRSPGSPSPRPWAS